MNPVDKLKQLMAKLVELPSTPNKLDLAIDFCSDGEFPNAQAVSNAIISDIQRYNDPKRFLWEKCNIDLENDDVGSIVGLDASGGPILDKYDIVPENGTVADLVIPPTQEIISGLLVTYPPYDSLNDSGKFIMACMSKWWLKGAFDLVEQGYGLTFNTNSFTTTMPVQLDDIPAGNGSIIMAYVSSTFDSLGTTSSIFCAVNTNIAAYGDMDLTDLNGRSNSYAGSRVYLDRTLCHELVHGIMSANIPGFNTALPTWFCEGTAELIAGADDTRKDELLATANSVSMFQEGLNENITDTLRWYTTGYIWLRWFIKHTSSLLPDLSFEHSLPDIEIFEYKVSDHVAFEWGRANNCKFNLVSDELLDFVLRSHSGLSKWDLCTSKEYLHSGYGATVRVPYVDVSDYEELDYIDIGYSYEKNEVIFTSPFNNYDQPINFVYTYPNIVGTFAYGAPIPHTSSEKYKDAYNFLSSLTDNSVVNKFVYSIDQTFSSWNSMLGITNSGYTCSDYADINLPFKVRHILLIGSIDLSSLFNISLGMSSVELAIDNLYQEAVAGDFYLKFYDFSFLSLTDIVNNNVLNTDYVNSLTRDSNTDLEILEYIRVNRYKDRLQYYDCRKSILDKFPTVDDFRNIAICNYLPSNIFFGPYPNMQGNNACLTEFFADIVWDNIDLNIYFRDAEFKEIDYTLPNGYVKQSSFNVYYELSFSSVRDQMIANGIYYEGLTGFLSLFSPIYNEFMYKEVKYGGPKFNATPMQKEWYPDFGHYPTFSSLYPVIVPGNKQDVIDQLDNQFYVFYMGGTGTRGQVIVSGFEVLCAFDFSVSEVIAMIKRWSSDIYNVETNVLNVAFIPTCIYSKTIYDFYIDIKNECINNNIPIALDNYVCMNTGSIDEYRQFCSLIYHVYEENSYEYNTFISDYKRIVDDMNSSASGDEWVYFSGGLEYFYFESTTNKLMVLDSHISYTKKPCYYISFTDLPFSDMIVPDKEIAIQAIDGVAGDVLSVNLHTIYDPLSPAYYQGGGVCKPVYDFVVDPVTNKTITGLINHHNDGANVPNVDANYSYPVYGTGCPWIVYPDDMKELYDVIYFYFTRDDFTGTITYQLSSSHDDSVKPIYQTIVYGSTDTDNYTSKYPLYVGGGLSPFSPTQYTYIYQPPKPPGADKAPPAVPVTVMGNKYNFDLTTTMSSNTLPLYPIHPQDSKISNFALKCADGEWKFISSFDSHNVESPTEDFPCLYTLSDIMRWGVMLPYVGSDFYNMYVYDKYFDNMRQLKPLRVLNPNMPLKEELGFGAITLPWLWASHTDNVHGLRTLTASNYESKSILDIAFMQSVADGDVINIHGNYDAYGGDVNFNSSLGPYGVGPYSLVFTDPFDEFDRVEVIFTEDSGTNRYVASWTKAELYEAIFGSRDLDFDITRGCVHPLYWKINKSGCNKTVFYGLAENCGIIDVIGYKKRSFRYLVVPNGYSKREFNMFAYSNDKDNTLDYKQQFAIYNEIINSYRLNNDLYIYVGS